MLSESKIKTVCIEELQENSSDGDLADEREKALKYYYGDMDDYISVEEDRSRITTRDVLDTIESVLPSLMKIFVEEENAVTFKAVSQQDEPQAELETKAVRAVFFSENNGFLNLYTFLKDALLSKVGIFKVWSEEENDWDREEYEGLDPVEAQAILNDETIEYQIEEAEVNDDGTIDLVCLTKKKQVSVKVDVVTPEEFGVSGDARSIDIKEARFCWQTSPKTIGDLKKMGFEEEKLDEIAFSDDDHSKQGLARRNLSDERESDHDERSMRTVWVTECYPLIDRNEDGIAERLKVTLAGSAPGEYANLTLLDVEESLVPFSSGSPVLLTHKFYGYSLADLVMDIQEMRTVLMRGIYDNVYLANNGQTGANDNVNIKDLQTKRPGGIVRTKGTSSPIENISPLPHTTLMPETFGLLEKFDEMKQGRTGVGDEVAGLDANALANINTGVMMQAYSQARMRIELMARILAETGLKHCFLDIHRELHLNQSKAVQMKINNQWVDVDPRIWKKDRKIEVKVGIGNADKVRRKAALVEILQLQEKAQATGYMTPDHLHNTVEDLISLEGMDVNRYFPDPQTFKPPQKQPDPLVMIEAEKLKLEQQKIQIEGQKIQADMQLKLMIEQSKDKQAQIKADIEQMKAQYQFEKMAVDEQSQIMNAKSANLSAEVNTQLAIRDQAHKEHIDELKALLEQQKLEQKNYEAELKTQASLEEKVMEVNQKTQSDVIKHIEVIAQMMQKSEMERENQRMQIMQYINDTGSDRMKAFVNGLGK